MYEKARNYSLRMDVYTKTDFRKKSKKRLLKFYLTLNCPLFL
jgi:hypothetical protein